MKEKHARNGPGKQKNPQQKGQDGLPVEKDNFDINILTILV